MTDELVAFLKARLDEDARSARAATPGPWALDEFGEDIKDPVPSALTLFGQLVSKAGEYDKAVANVGNRAFLDGGLRTLDARHIARWDPARALAEVAATRRIIDLHSDGGSSQGYTESGYDVMQHACETCGSFGEYGVPWPCPTLRLLALPYASHPDYRAEWSPDAEVSDG